MSPKASFVIPCHNDALFINRAIQSCLHGSVKDIEVVVVDDCSTDGSLEAIHWAAKDDGRINTIVLDKHVGASEARNRGNEVAQGEIIMVLDSDDLSTKNRARETLALFEAKNPDVVYGQFYNIDELGFVNQKCEANVFSPEEARKTGLNRICHSTMAYRKGVTRNVRYDSEYGALGLDDWKFQWDCHTKGYKFAVSKKPFCFYRDNPKGLTHNRDKNEVKRLKEAYFATATV